jgi:hypothetical protein
LALPACKVSPRSEDETGEAQSERGRVFPQLIDGKVFVPIVLSILEDGMCIDEMREMPPDEPVYERTLAWAKENQFQETAQDSTEASGST